MNINGMEIKIPGENHYRPEELIINGEKASMDLFLAKHGYNWKTSAHGNILFYRTESGKEYKVPQKELMSRYA